MFLGCAFKQKKTIIEIEKKNPVVVKIPKLSVKEPQ